MVYPASTPCSKRRVPLRADDGVVWGEPSVLFPSPALAGSRAFWTGLGPFREEPLSSERLN
eukprot:686599-Lingulodinium_polyedra.AAC.1